MNYDMKEPMPLDIQRSMLWDRFGPDAAKLKRLAFRLPRYRKLVKSRYRWHEVVDLDDAIKVDMEARAVLDAIPDSKDINA